MAIMLPEKPKHYNTYSLEGIIFDKLSNLNDDYYVFHSFEINKIADRKNYDFEIDFIIFHAAKGIIILEAKAGQIRYENNQWLYSNGIPMSHDGPFTQAKNNKYELKEYIKQKKDPFDILKTCKFSHSVCFPSIKDGTLNNIILPANAPREIILSYEDLNNIEVSIDRIFKYDDQKYNMEKDLNESQVHYLINSILAPKFNLVPSMDIINKEKNKRFNRMIEEQIVLLDFLHYQKIATIAGAAGTGKTMIAIEKAKRLADQGDKVLFLCYNKNLNTFLRSNYENYNVDYYTLDAFSYKITGLFDNTFQKLENHLTEVFANDKDFEYDHIIIDEGQDFGLNDINEQKIIEILDLIIKNKNGNFYIFYDRNQLVNSFKIPDYIVNSDCKITLYKNCRNTIKIADTSMKVIDKKAELFDSAIIGTKPVFKVIKNDDDTFSYINLFIDKYLKAGYKDIVILSLKSYEKSVLYEKYRHNYYLYNNKEYQWTTTRKYKGLEADVIILIDVEDEIFQQDKLLFYVGASRARFELGIIANLSDESIKDVAKEKYPSLLRYNSEKILSIILDIDAI